MLGILSLIGLAAKVVPAIADAFTGDDTPSSARTGIAQIVGDVAQAVTGLSTPEEAATAIQADPELAAKFQDQIRQRENDLYGLATQRLVAEQGEVNAATLHELPEAMRAKVAWLRMTTRPWAVRWCVRSLVFPPLGVIGADTILQGLNVVSAAFGWISSLPVIRDGAVTGYQVVALHFDLIGPTLLGSGSGFTTLYSWFAPTATSIVISYMGLREIGKVRDKGVTVSDAAGAAAGALKKLFGR